MVDFINELIGEKVIVKESSGSSKVYISDDNKDLVLQKFNKPEVSSRIAEIMVKLLQINEINIPLKIQKGYGPRKQVLLDSFISYKPFKYIVPFEFYVPKENIIAWKKILTLNSMKLPKKFYENNILKIWYDISKALLTLKSINIVHNDCVLDNIGIYQGNFVLFDFDGSGDPDTKQKDFQDDYLSLYNSFTITHEVITPKFEGIISIINFVAEKNKITHQEAVKFLENLSIQGY